MIPLLASCTGLGSGKSRHGGPADSVGGAASVIDLPTLPSAPARLQRALWVQVPKVSVVEQTIKMETRKADSDKAAPIDPKDVASIAEAIRQEIRSQAAQVEHFRVLAGEPAEESGGGEASGATSHYQLQGRILRMDIGPAVTLIDKVDAKGERVADAGIEIFRTARNVTVEMRIDLVSTGLGPDGRRDAQSQSVWGVKQEIVASGFASEALRVIFKDKVIEQVATIDQNKNVAVKREANSDLEDGDDAERMMDERFVPSIATLAVRKCLISMLESARPVFDAIDGDLAAKEAAKAQAAAANAQK